MKFSGKLLVEGDLDSSPRVSYQVLKNVLEAKRCECFILPNLSSSFSLVLSTVKIIITHNGSVLSHLAILAREFNKPVILIGGNTPDIPETGWLSITRKKENEVDVEI